MTKSKQRLEKALERAKSLFAPIYECAREDFEEEKARKRWTKTELKKICRWYRKGHKNWCHLRDMLERDFGVIYIPNGTPRCYTFPTSKDDNLESVIAACLVEEGLQTRTSYLLLWRSDPNTDFALEAEELELLEKLLGKLAARTKNRQKFLASGRSEEKALEEGK